MKITTEQAEESVIEIITSAYETSLLGSCKVCVAVRIIVNLLKDSYPYKYKKDLKKEILQLNEREEELEIGD